MQVKFKNIKFMQEGGEMPVQEGAPVEEAPVEGAPQGGDPMQQLLEMAVQALQTQDANLAFQVCQALVQLAQGAQGGAPEPQGEPVYRRGGQLVRRIRK